MQRALKYNFFVIEMEVNEIRVGNIVAIPGHGASVSGSVAKQIKAVTLFGELDFSTKSVHELYSARHCSGVQLTIAWLIRMGFEVKNGSNEFVKGVIGREGIRRGSVS